MADLARHYTGSVRLLTCAGPAECIRDADFVFAAIRAGGMEARIQDESVPLQLGVVGQETVGAGGFAMAMRTIPPILAYARQVERLAPEAWIINLTNPVGIITQAVQTQTGAKIIGICDTPTELFEHAARALGLPLRECRFDFFGLNHLGWLREVYHHRDAHLDRLWSRPEAIPPIYRAPLFEPERLASLRLLPTEYVYFYDQPERALDNLRRAGQTRGQAIQALNERLFRDLEDPARDPIESYETYLVARDAGYMRIESGSRPLLERNGGEEVVSGYERIALAVVRAIVQDSGDVITVDVANNGAMAELEDEDVIEVPSVVDREGARPLPVRPLPDSARQLIRRVKVYERLTVEAALSQSNELATEALYRNPLVGDRALAHRLTERLQLK
jgi:6-phospho-beta-glucosidase